MIIMALGQVKKNSSETSVERQLALHSTNLGDFVVVLHILHIIAMHLLALAQQNFSDVHTILVITA